MEQFSLAAQTMFAELVQQSMDAEFDETYDERGNFVRKRINGRLYWYYQRKVAGKVQQTYVGPVKEEAVNARVRNFDALKSDFKRRREIVRALVAIGFPTPDSLTGMIIEALWKAGFFRLRGVLVGTAAFQCYAGLLGVRLGSAALMTQDLDAAQFYDVSHMVNDSMPPMIDVLREVDASFEAVPDTFYPTRTSRFRSRRTGYLVEFLTPNRGSDRNTGRPAEMPALGGASATPLRFLDYLIHEPVRSVVLYKAGIPVTVPSPFRYAVHKLVIAPQRRENQAKAGKDVAQAEQLIRASLAKHSFNLFESWIEAWERGPAWRTHLMRGLSMLDQSIRKELTSTLESHGWSQQSERRPIPRKQASAARRTGKRK